MRIKRGPPADGSVAGMRNRKQARHVLEQLRKDSVRLREQSTELIATSQRLVRHARQLIGAGRRG